MLQPVLLLSYVSLRYLLQLLRLIEVENKSTNKKDFASQHDKITRVNVTDEGRNCDQMAGSGNNSNNGQISWVSVKQEQFCRPF